MRQQLKRRFRSSFRSRLRRSRRHWKTKQGNNGKRIKSEKNARKQKKQPRILNLLTPRKREELKQRHPKEEKQLRRNLLN